LIEKKRQIKKLVEIGNIMDNYKAEKSDHSESPNYFLTKNGRHFATASQILSRKEARESVEYIAKSCNNHKELVDVLRELFEDWQTLTEQDYNEGNEDVLKLQIKVRAALEKE
jgi:hypothetical protein